MHNADPQLDEAGRLAERVEQEIRDAGGSLTPAYQELEVEVRRYADSGAALDDIVPGADELALGFNRDRPNGTSIWTAYAKVIREDVCRPEGDLHRQLSQGAAATGASVVTLLLGVVGLPLVAAPVIAPMAGSLLALGVKAFCAMVAESEVRP
jgi:hypothetical protein